MKKKLQIERKNPCLVSFIFSRISHDNPMIRRACFFYLTTFCAMFLPGRAEPHENSNNVQHWHPDCTENVAYFPRNSIVCDAETLKWVELVRPDKSIHCFQPSASILQRLTSKKQRCLRGPVTARV